MKPTTLLSSIFLFMILFFISQPAHAISTDKGKMVIVITNKTNKAQLDSIQKVVTAQGGEIDFDGFIYSNTGELKSISGTISFPPKTSATFKSDNVGTITITKKGAALKVEVADLPKQ